MVFINKNVEFKNKRPMLYFDDDNTGYLDEENTVKALPFEVYDSAFDFIIRDSSASNMITDVMVTCRGLAVNAAQGLVAVVAANNGEDASVSAMGTYKTIAAFKAMTLAQAKAITDTYGRTDVPFEYVLMNSFAIQDSDANMCRIAHVHHVDNEYIVCIKTDVEADQTVVLK